MKTKLLLFLLSMSCISFSQSITSFTSNPGTSLTIMNASSGIDQTPTGANSTWNFNNLTASGINIDTYATPTAAQLTEYPGTTEVLTITTQGGTPTTSDFFLKQDGSGTSITGVSQGDIILNYNTQNAFIGLFPMNFGTNNSNPVSGTFSYQGTNGTFTGTLTATAEAHGSLTISDGASGNYSGTVTRLRVDQSLSFSIPPIFNNIGTLTQTTYYYYDNTDNNIVFRYNNANLVSGFLGVNDTTETYESTPLTTLSTTDFEIVEILKIYPNPAKDSIYLNLKDNDKPVSVIIYDNLGRAIYSKNQNLNKVDISKLNAGLHIISVKTENGKSLSKKFIKE